MDEVKKNKKNTIGTYYTTIQCLQKHYRPDGAVIKMIQNQCSSYSSASSHQTTDSINERFPRTRRSTRKKFPHHDNFSTRNERKTQGAGDRVLALRANLGSDFERP